MEARITLSGNIGTDIDAQTSKAGKPWASFRLACSPGYRDRESGDWVEETTIWLRVRCHGELARNVSMSLKKGYPITVSGRLRVDSWVGADNQLHERFEIVADHIGPNLAYGTAAFSRSRSGRPLSERAAEEDAAEPNDDTSQSPAGDPWAGMAAATPPLERVG